METGYAHLSVISSTVGDRVRGFARRTRWVHWLLDGQPSALRGAPAVRDDRPDTVASAARDPGGCCRVTARAVRAVLLFLGAVLLAVTATHAWPSKTPVQETAAAGTNSPPSGVFVKEAPDRLHVDRGASDVHGHNNDGWRRVATGFIADLASHDGDHTAWHRRVSRWLTPALAETYRHTDPRLLPAAGSGRVLAWDEGLGVVQAIVAQDDGAIVVMTLQRRHVDDSWLVSDAQPVAWSPASQRNRLFR